MNFKPGLIRHLTVVTGTSLLVSPSLDDFNAYLQFMRNSTKNKPYGHRSFSGADEQSITEFYIHIKKTNFTNIHHTYSYMAWKHKSLAPHTLPIIIHYLAYVKPWNMKYNEYEDVITWYQMMYDAILYTQQPIDEMCTRLKINKENLLQAHAAENKYKATFSGGATPQKEDVLYLLRKINLLRNRSTSSQKEKLSKQVNQLKHIYSKLK